MQQALLQPCFPIRGNAADFLLVYHKQGQNAMGIGKEFPAVYAFVNRYPGFGA